ncbi:MAG: hypothetical protein HOO67_00905, partial [Candidatus Peribacteraceae bacterium]|nr:hypothetical protein [Candidatus Peribacteraceae bacterium]
MSSRFSFVRRTLNHFSLATLILNIVFGSLAAGLPIFAAPAFAATTNTAATGGSAISSTTVDGAYTTLTGPIIAEGVTADIGVGTIILNVPTGFVFDTGGSAPTVKITGSATASRNINGAANNSNAAITSRTTTQITFTVVSTSNTATTNTLTWQNVRVRPSAALPVATGNITKTGTSVISGVTDSVTNLGTLTEVAPTCNGLPATLFVTAGNKIVGGPNNGATYANILNDGPGNGVAFMPGGSG